MNRTDRNDAFLRKRKERQRRRRRRRIIAFLVVFIIMILAAGVVLSLTVFFPIDCIKASGSEKYNYDQLVSACGIKDGDNLFMVSAEKTADSLRTALPYIDKVKLKRQLPGTVEITVTDAKEYACFNVSGKYYTVSDSWRVLAVYDKPPSGILEIKAGKVSCKIGEKAEFSAEKPKETVDSLLKSADAQKLKINYIDITDEINITVKAEGRFLVNLGTANNIESKITHLGGMIKNLDKNKTGRVNLSMWTSGNTEGTFVEGKID